MQGFISLAAGPLTMLFAKEQAFLRHVRYGDKEVVRGVFAAVRDRDWNTVPFSVSDFELEQSEEAFTLRLFARCAQGGIQFDWRVLVEGTREGRVSYRFDGEAKTTFLKNRIGLCVLHPIRECAGTPCRVEHTDGRVSENRFPQGISPHQPFKNLRSIAYVVENGVEARVTMAGEACEIEDQRNWTDASFKTYSTPLELPFPVEIETGEKVSHEVTIELLGPFEAARPPAPTAQGPRITIDWQRSRKRPPIGFSMATCKESASAQVIQKLKELAPGHLRVDLRLAEESANTSAREALALAESVGCRLEVALFTSNFTESTWPSLCELFESQRRRIARWLVLHPTAKATPAELQETADQVLAKRFPEIPFVVGTNAYFAELNRNRPPAGSRRPVCYSVNPQVHAFDNLSLAETLEAQPWTVDSAHEIFGGQAVISPITLRPRFNPNATSTKSESPTEPETDERQATGFAEAWTAGTIAGLASHPQVASLTYYETFGPRGLMDRAGNAYPMFAVFQALAGMNTIAPGISTLTLQIAGFGLDDSRSNRRVVVANLSPERLMVFIDSGSGRSHEISLEAESVHIISEEDLG